MNQHREFHATALLRLQRLCLAAAVTASCTFGSPTARATEPSAQPSALELRVKEIELSNKLAAAKFGPAATGKAGDIAGTDKLAALASLLQPTAYETLAKAIVGGLPPSIDVVITTRSNLGSLIASAHAVKAEVDRLLKQGEALAPSQQPPTFGAVSVPAALAMIGAADALASLFRADYTAASSEVTKNPLGLLLAVQRECARTQRTCRVDSLDLLPVDPGELGESLLRLEEAIQRVSALPPLGETDQDKATKAQRDNFLSAAITMITALAKPDATGISPLAHAALLLSLDGTLGGVLYIDSVGVTATAVTSKRLFSRNAKVHLKLTGLLNVVYQKRDGTLFRSATMQLGESATLNLRALERNSNPPLAIATSQAF